MKEGKLGTLLDEALTYTPQWHHGRVLDVRTNLIHICISVMVCLSSYVANDSFHALLNAFRQEHRYRAAWRHFAQYPRFPQCVPRYLPQRQAEWRRLRMDRGENYYLSLPSESTGRCMERHVGGSRLQMARWGISPSCHHSPLAVSSTMGI